MIEFCFILFLFFFKQKTAYEMRISDWSSDVCSSDLRAAPPKARKQGWTSSRIGPPAAGRRQAETGLAACRPVRRPAAPHRTFPSIHMRSLPAAHRRAAPSPPLPRSEEHTSELQSLMRISYAVFCLKTKNTPKQHSCRDKGHYHNQTSSPRITITTIGRSHETPENI